MSNTVDVKIHGQIFRIKADADQDYVRELESYVEGILDNLEKAARKTRTVDSYRIALMAALKIADDYLQLKRTCEGYSAEVHEKVNALIDRSNQLLD